MKHSFTLVLLVLLGVVFAGDKFDWGNAKKVQQGVCLLAFRLDAPRLMEINLMRVDLRQKGIFFIATGRDADWGKPMPDYPQQTMRTKRIRTADFMKQARLPKSEGGLGLHVIVAANASPWTPWTKPFTHRYGDPMGLNISAGQIVSAGKVRPAMFCVSKSGKVSIVKKLTEQEIRNLEICVTGFAPLILNGKMQPPLGYEKKLMPRMAYGLSQDKRYLYFLTIDGRQPGRSLGATGPETAELLRRAGAYDAIDMDGGGSATLCYFDEKTQKPVMVNCHNIKTRPARQVGSSIAIAVTPEKSTK